VNLLSITITDHNTWCHTGGVTLGTISARWASTHMPTCAFLNIVTSTVEHCPDRLAAHHHFWLSFNAVGEPRDLRSEYRNADCEVARAQKTEAEPIKRGRRRLSTARSSWSG
jgi:hypothetical protein